MGVIGVIVTLVVVVAVTVVRVMMPGVDGRTVVYESVARVARLTGVT